MNELKDKTAIRNAWNKFRNPMPIKKAIDEFDSSLIINKKSVDNRSEFEKQFNLSKNQSDLLLIGAKNSKDKISESDAKTILDISSEIPYDTFKKILFYHTDRGAYLHDVWMIMKQQNLKL